MSVILQPQVAFPLTRVIANHTDSTTYYVRAVIRNAAGDIIDTVALDAQGDQRYQSSWMVPADQTGRGSYISIITSVYTDSGYTTKSPDYGDEENTYLVFDRVLPAMRGGGSGLDSRTVRRIIQEELDKLPKPEKVEFPEIKEPEMRWNEVLVAIAEMRDALDRVPTERTDLTPIASQLSELARAIEEKPVTPETDLTPIIDRLDDDKEDSEIDMSEVKDMLRGMESKLVAAIPKEIKQAIEKTRFVSQFNTFALPQEPVREEKEEIFDISKLAS